MKQVIGIVKINLRQAKITYLVSGIVILLGIANSIVSLCVEDSGALPIGNYLFILPIFLAIFIPTLHFNKLMNLGGKRIDFFKSCILTYLPIIAITCLISLALYPNIDTWAQGKEEISLSLWDAFKFIDNNPIVAYLQMFSLITLLVCFIHTLTLIQSRWYGWLTDIILIAIISVFTPIAPLRSLLVWFFNLIIFQDLAIIQILSCIILSGIIYFLSLLPIKNKKI